MKLNIPTFKIPRRDGEARTVAGQRQSWKVYEEAQEVVDAAYDMVNLGEEDSGLEAFDHLIEETVDVITAAANLLHMFGLSEDYVQGVVQKVYEKNYKRGRYQEGWKDDVRRVEPR